ncbi:MAG: prepilin-type N-terminal cleavage/methylation domain-containing protein [bacterium]
MNILKNSSRAGFSFVEIVMSIMIIAVVAVYLATAIPTAYLITQETQNISKASDLAQKYIENVRHEVLASAGSYDAVEEGSDPPVEVTDDITDNDYYTVNTYVTDLETETINDQEIVTLKQIDIDFIRTNSENHLVSLSTILERPR